MNDFEKKEVQFDEQDIEQIFGGDAVMSDYGNNASGTQAVQQQQRLQEQQTVASDNLS